MKIVVYNDRDPTWFNDKIRFIIKEKTTAYRYFRQNINNAYWQHRLKLPQSSLNNPTESSKEKYYQIMANKLQNTKKTSSCLSLLKIFLNNEKIPLIPPLFHMYRTAQKMKFSITDFFSKYDYIRRKLRVWSDFEEIVNRKLFFFFFEQCRFISDFKHKAEIFNHFFSNQCSLLNNNRKLSANLNHITDRCISSVTFSAGDIGKVIKKRIGIPISVFGHWKFVMTPLINL